MFDYLQSKFETVIICVSYDLINPGLAKKLIFLDKSAVNFKVQYCPVFSPIIIKIISMDVYFFQIKMLLSKYKFFVVVNSTVFYTMSTGVIRKSKKFLQKKNSNLGFIWRRKQHFFKMVFCYGVLMVVKTKKICVCTPILKANERLVGAQLTNSQYMTLKFLYFHN